MRKACVIGWPIAHSRSPMIHGYWLKVHGIEGAYEKVPVEPGLAVDFLRTLESRGYVGCNVTLPHKEAAFATVDALDPLARALGAVNTVWVEDGVLHGTNTDVGGFLANLDVGAPGWDGACKTALIIGAGGAARGIVHGLLSRGVARVLVANRTYEKAGALAQACGPKVRAVEFSALRWLMREADLLVNATSLGMIGQPPLDLPLDGLRESAVVTDAVYAPLMTPLLVEAAARGNRVVGGLGMLLHQAVAGFETWFGVRPTVTAELTRLIEADVEAAYPRARA